MTERQLELITAAGKILSINGVHGLTIKNLAKEMQFSESAVYRHFKSKEEIILTLLEYLAREIDIKYKNTVNPNYTPIENLNALFNAQFSYFKANPFFVDAVFSDSLLENKSEINKAVMKIMAVKKNHLLKIISAGIKDGSFNNQLNEEEYAHIIMGAIRLLMFKWKVSEFSFDIEEQGNAVLSSLIKLIKV